MPEIPIPRIDVEVKDAFVKALGRAWKARDDGSRRYEGHALREVVLPCEQDTLDAVSKLIPTVDPAESNEDRSTKLDTNSNKARANFLLAEVVEFCPFPLCHWQEEAEKVLKEHREGWINKLNRLRESLMREPMFAIPFGRFLISTESANDWVSPVKTVCISCDDVFVNWAEAKAGAESSENVWYYIRPYIIWPTQSPGSSTHVTHLAGGTSITLTRPDLRHFSLQERRVTQRE